MGLAINGDTVHGFAVGGQAFQSINQNSDGSLNFNGSKYIDLSNLKFKNHTVLDLEGVQHDGIETFRTNTDLTNWIGKNVFIYWGVTEGANGDTDYKKYTFCTNVFKLNMYSTASTASGDGNVIVICTSSYLDLNVQSENTLIMNPFNGIGEMIEVG